ncbi:MAG: 2-oxo acid dehydrogenase subunit E2, partial [Nanoarchaeota archaeon]|nr:2-oxo acid dehydrogenase subunit E2 [Nanoarchaeota archaeon]
ILGTGRIEDKVVVINGKIEIRKVMPISFTYDHRALDGAEAARFMNDLRDFLEKPGSLVD